MGTYLTHVFRSGRIVRSGESCTQGRGTLLPFVCGLLPGLSELCLTLRNGTSVGRLNCIGAGRAVEGLLVPPIRQGGNSAA